MHLFVTLAELSALLAAMVRLVVVYERTADGHVERALLYDAQRAGATWGYILVTLTDRPAEAAFTAAVPRAVRVELIAV